MMSNGRFPWKCSLIKSAGNQRRTKNCQEESGRYQPCPEFIKLFSCSAQLRLKFILLINVKMPTIVRKMVGILTFISRINYRLWSSKPSILIYLGYFGIYEDLKFQAQLS